MINLKDKKILVTGGNGFIGRNLIEKLKAMGIRNIIAPGSKEFDLREQTAARELFTKAKPEVVFHCAALVGGVLANMTMKGKFFYENIMMNTMVFEEARKNDVEKLIVMGSGCIYPKFVSVPIKEEYLWDGYPEDTNAPYAFTKRMQYVQSQAYREQYDFNSIVIMPGNAYGPYDNFHPEDSHVTPALIRKFVEAVENNDPEVKVWGDGSAVRDFVYVEDIIDGVLALAEKYDSSDPINLSNGEAVSIKQIASLIKEITGFKGEMIWDTSKPTGQQKRWFDVSKLKGIIDFKPKYSLSDGLRKTIDWYKKNKLDIRIEKK